MKRFRAALYLCIICLMFSSPVYARSAYNPRHSGIEPPGGPRPLENMPGNSPSRTSEGGMGYTDAYGNTIENKPKEENLNKKRINPGAYGKKTVQESPSGLPGASDGPPVWKFQ